MQVMLLVSQPQPVPVPFLNGDMLLNPRSTQSGSLCLARLPCQKGGGNTQFLAEQGMVNIAKVG